MITILLIDKNSRELSRVSEPSNADYLVQEFNDRFSYLTSANEYSPSLFRRNDMPDLINEFLLLRHQLSNRPLQHDAVSHANIFADNILLVVQRCVGDGRARQLHRFKNRDRRNDPSASNLNAD